MARDPYGWEDSPSTDTPISAANLEDFGDQVYTEALADAATAANSALSTHTADTTAVHGIADTSALATSSSVSSAVAAHEADTTNVHGITNTALLETTTGSQAKVDAHVNDTSAAHAASAISFSPTGTISSTDLQAALAEVASEAGGGGGGATEFATNTGLTFAGTHTTTIGTETWASSVASLTANHVETLAGRAAGKFALWRIKQDATGGRTFSVSDGTTPASVPINSAANAVSLVLAFCPNGTDIDIAVLGGGGASNASALTFTPAGNLAATNTQAAIEELDTEKAAASVPVTTQTTDYTLVLGDANSVIRINSASARLVTVPPNSSVAFPTGTIIEIVRVGAGTVTLVPGSGVTVNSENGMLAVAAQYAEVSLLKVATDTWSLVGRLI